MCGIGGILRTDGEPIPDEWLDAIDARIAYRGPDGHGRFRDRVEIATPEGEKRIVEIALVHRRLSIIDHDDGGQPMISQRGRDDEEGLVAVVFNGCIYNHRELRAELEGLGHSFTTDHSDTEVLIHGWREWKEKLTEHLEGMYAFAVWDRAAASLYLARDWFGEKPFYFAQLGACGLMYLFASEPEALQTLETGCQATSFPDQNHWSASYLRSGYGPGGTPLSSEAPYQAAPISVGPAESICCDVRSSRGARLRIDPPHAKDEIEFEQLIDQAVARRLEADVPLGCFLSGGVDSSLITYFAKKHKPDLKTFSVRMPDPRYDESAYAQQVADHLGTDHTTLDVDPHPAEDLVTLIDILGQPFGDSSILPTYWVSKAARQHVKVAISGDGGDELFIGYERYMAARTLAKHYRLLRRLPSDILRRFHPKSRLHKLGRLADMARDYPHLGVAAMESLFTNEQIRRLLDVSPSTRPGRPFFSHKQQAQLNEDGYWGYGDDDDHPVDEGRASDPLVALRQFDIHNYLPNDLLRKVDTASMACALEVRCPFLDRDLARAALSTPIGQLIPGGQRKGLLRQIARQYLPASIVDRPKMGFAIPIGEWFRDDSLPSGGGGMKTLLLDHLNSADPFGPIELNRKAVQRFIDEHMAGKRDHSHRLFTLLTLSIWAKLL